MDTRRGSALLACAFTALFMLAEATEAQVRRGGGRGPTISTELVGGHARAVDDGVTFRIAVQIPPGHHGYVDKGDDGFYIPFSFTFPALTEAGGESTVLSRPNGVRDEKVKALVLRGRGEFEFGLRPVEALDGLDEIEASLRYQVCNDRSGICYPPRRLAIDVALP